MKKNKIFASGYGDAGASRVRRSLRGFRANSASPASDIDANNQTLRERARMLTMASPIAASAINTNRTKVVGSGLRMRPAPRRDILGLGEEAAKAWRRRTEAEFCMWAESSECDVLGLNNLYGLEALALRSWLSSGDVFALLCRTEPSGSSPYSLRIHLIEADRVATPTEVLMSGSPVITEGINPENGNAIHDGVEVDKSGKVVAYHIRSTHPHDISAKPTEWHRIPVRGERTGELNILHIMESERPDQYRGVSYLAPIIEPLLQMRRYTESELMAALIQSFFTAWIKTSSPQSEIPFNETGAGGFSSVIDGNGTDEVRNIEIDDNVSSSENEYEMGPGTINHLAEGEDITFGSPNIPTAGFSAFSNEIITQMGAALEIPHDVLIKSFNSSYSASKGALEEAWEAFKMRRSNLIYRFCKPVYEAFLAEAVALGRISARGFFDDPLTRYAWSGARFDGPAQTHLDPVKEAKANEILVAHNWKTDEQVTREYYGGSFEENAENESEEK